MAKLKAVLIDLDGTLRDTRDAIYESLQQALKIHTGQEYSREEIKPHVSHHTVVHKAFASHISQEEFENTYHGFADPAIDRAVLYDGVENLLVALQNNGYKTAIVTSARQGRAEKFLEAVKLVDNCNVIVGMQAGREPKPAPDLVQAALHELDCTPDEAVMVGDMTVDVEAAHAAGVRCIGITHGFASKSELEAAGADTIIDNLAELPDTLERFRQAED